MKFFGEDTTIKVILFVYLYQVNDWFGAAQTECEPNNNDSCCQYPDGYLSRCKVYKSKI